MNDTTTHVSKEAQRALRLKIAGFLASVVSVALLAQAFALNRALMTLTEVLPNDNVALQAAWPPIFRATLGVSFLVLAPVMLGLGVLLSKKVAGPVGRLEEYLRQVARGGDPGACVVEGADGLQGVCELITEVTDPLRVVARAASTTAGATVVGDIENVASLIPSEVDEPTDVGRDV